MGLTPDASTLPTLASRMSQTGAHCCPSSTLRRRATVGPPAPMHWRHVGIDEALLAPDFVDNGAIKAVKSAIVA